MGFSQTFQLLSRCGIVLREVPGSTDPVRLRAEEMLIPDGALGKRGSLLPKVHGLASVIADNGHLILRWIERGHIERHNRLCAAGSGKRTEHDQNTPSDVARECRTPQLVHSIPPRHPCAAQRRASIMEQTGEIRCIVVTNLPDDESMIEHGRYRNALGAGRLCAIQIDSTDQIALAPGRDRAPS